MNSTSCCCAHFYARISVLPFYLNADLAGVQGNCHIKKGKMPLIRPSLLVPCRRPGSKGQSPLQSLRTDRSNGASGPRTIDYDNGKSFRSRRFPVIGDTADTRDGKPVKGTVEYRSPVCRARICRKSPLIFQHPSFILARRNNRHHFRVSSRMMPMPPGYTKVFGFAPTWCTTNSLTET